MSTAQLTYQTIASNGKPSNITISLPYNPNNVTWSYQLNRQTFDTYGGRVIQLLSTQAQTLMFQGEAGSRKNMIYVYDQLKLIQESQIQTQASAKLVIPVSFDLDGKIDQQVWIEQVSVGFGTDTVTYPYQIAFEIDSAGSTTLNDTLLGAELAQIPALFSFGNSATGGIGFYNNGYYQGLNTSSKINIAQMAQYLSGQGPQTSIGGNASSWNP